MGSEALALPTSGESGEIEEINRRDLRNAICIIVPFSVRPMSMIEANDPALNHDLLFGDDYKGVRLGYANSVAQYIRDCFAETLELATIDVEPRPYHVGPNAQSFPTWILNFYQDARPLLTDTAMLWALGQAGKAILSRFRQYLGRNNLVNVDSSVPLLFSEPILTSMCFLHFCETYNPKSKVRIESHLRVPYHGFGDADHPGGGESYTVAFRSGRKTYIYEITNRAEVLNHYVISGGKISMLRLPYFADSDWVLDSPESGPLRLYEVDVERTVERRRSVRG